MRRRLLLGMAVGGFLAACSDASPKPKATMKLTSSAFAEGQPIPQKYTGQGDDISPPLKWADAPAGTRSFALICDDPDAPVGTWVHWVIYRLGPELTELAENVPPAEHVPNGARQGLNDWHRIGYGGPMPPPGRAHRYFFRIYALDTALDLAPRATKQQLLRAIEGHILAEGRLMGTYQRR